MAKDNTEEFLEERTTAAGTVRVQESNMGEDWFVIAYPDGSLDVRQGKAAVEKTISRWVHRELKREG